MPAPGASAQAAPAAEEQRRLVEESDAKFAGLRVGETWYAVSSRWVAQWQAFVGGGAAPEGMDASDLVARGEDALLRALTADGASSVSQSTPAESRQRTSLKSWAHALEGVTMLELGVSEPRDFVLKHEQTFKLLSSWYPPPGAGAVAGVPARVEYADDGERDLVVELRPVVFKICLAHPETGEPPSDPSHFHALRVSRSSRMGDLLRLAVRELKDDVPAHISATDHDLRENARLWLRSSEDTDWRLVEADSDDEGDNDDVDDDDDKEEVDGDDAEQQPQGAARGEKAHTHNKDGAKPEASLNPTLRSALPASVRWSLLLETREEGEDAGKKKPWPRGLSAAEKEMQELDARGPRQAAKSFVKANPQAHQLLDAQCTKDDRWLEARIVKVEPSLITVHYLSFPDSMDESFEPGSERLKPPHTKVANWRSQLKVDDEVDVHKSALGRSTKKLDARGSWVHGSVVKIDRSGPAGGKILVRVKWGMMFSQQKNYWIALYSERIAKRYTHLPKPKQTYGIQATSGKPPVSGAVGLRNLGNTCFMNSMLQCLSNTEPLTSYFLSGNFVHDVNRKNPLGAGGQLAEAYAALMEQIWSDKYTDVVPSVFKRVLGQFASVFQGYQQQDSHEFLSLLMDGLHEDLNRVLKKPSTEPVEAKGRPDAQVAQEAWDVFKLRNDSMVLDTMMGLLRSHLTCPQCQNDAIKFDPYSNWSVPIPSRDEATYSVVLIRRATAPLLASSTAPTSSSSSSSPNADVGSVATRFSISVPKRSFASVLAQKLAEAAGIPLGDLVLASHWHNKIYSSPLFYEPDEDRALPRDPTTEDVVAYELEPLGSLLARLKHWRAGGPVPHLSSTPAWLAMRDMYVALESPDAIVAAWKKTGAMGPQGQAALAKMLRDTGLDYEGGSYLPGAVAKAAVVALSESKQPVIESLSSMADMKSAARKRAPRSASPATRKGTPVSPAAALIRAALRGRRAQKAKAVDATTPDGGPQDDALGPLADRDPDHDQGVEGDNGEEANKLGASGSSSSDSVSAGDAEPADGPEPTSGDGDDSEGGNESVIAELQFLKKGGGYSCIRSSDLVRLVRGMTWNEVHRIVWNHVKWMLDPSYVLPADMACVVEPSHMDKHGAADEPPYVLRRNTYQTNREVPLSDGRAYMPEKDGLAGKTKELREGFVLEWTESGVAALQLEDPKDVLAAIHKRRTAKRSSGSGGGSASSRVPNGESAADDGQGPASGSSDSDDEAKATTASPSRKQPSKDKKKGPNPVTSSMLKIGGGVRRIVAAGTSPLRLWGSAPLALDSDDLETQRLMDEAENRDAALGIGPVTYHVSVRDAWAKARGGTGAISLAECMEKFRIREQLGQGDEWYCPKCKEFVCAFKKMDLWDVPDVLVIHLKRFMYENSQFRSHVQREKITDPVSFPLEGLDMRPFVVGPTTSDDPPIYDCYACVDLVIFFDGCSFFSTPSLKPALHVSARAR